MSLSRELPRQHDEPANKGLLLAARGGGFALIGMLGARLLSLILQMVVARQFGAVFFGYYVTGLMVCRILQVVAGLGLPIGGVRYLVYAMALGDRCSMRRIYWRVVGSVALAGGVLGGALFFLGPVLCRDVFRDPELVPVLRLFGVALPWFALLRLLAELSRAFGTVRYTVLVEDILFFLVQLLIMSFAWLGHLDRMVAVQVFVFASLLCSLLLGGVVLRQIRRFEPGDLVKPADTVSAPDLRTILGYSLPLMPTGIIFMLGSNIDILMLNILSGGEAVGLYAAATRWTLLVDSMSAPLMAIFRPLLAGALRDGDMCVLRSLLRAVARWSLYLTLPWVAFLAVVAQPAIGFFLRTDLKPDSYILLWILLLGNLSNPLGNGAGLLLSMGGRQYRELLSIVCGAVLNVLLNIFLIPRYGVFGAATAMGLGYYLTTTLRMTAVWMIWRMTSWSTTMLVPLVVFALITIAVSFCSTTLALGWQVTCGAIAGIAVGGVLCYFGLERDDWRVMRQLPRPFVVIARKLEDFAGSGMGEK